MKVVRPEQMSLWARSVRNLYKITAHAICESDCLEYRGRKMKEDWKECKFKELYKIPSKNGVSKPSRIRGSGYKMINMGELFSYALVYTLFPRAIPKIPKFMFYHVESSVLVEKQISILMKLNAQDLVAFWIGLLKIGLRMLGKCWINVTLCTTLC